MNTTRVSAITLALASRFERAWYRLPPRARSSKPMVRLGKVVYEISRRQQKRTPGALYTRFFRNRPLLEVLGELIRGWAPEASLKLAVIGCSTGAELYSVLWMARNHRPDLQVFAFGLDLSETAIENARNGVYSLDRHETERALPEGTEGLFIRHEGYVEVTESLRKCVSWLVGDACEPRAFEPIGNCDIVLANNFLVHMADGQAATCLKNVVRTVVPGGYLCVWGINLDVRQEVVHEMGLIPVSNKVEEIYRADDRALEVWPWKYWGAEPLDKTRPDWMVRYSSIFRVPVQDTAAASGSVSPQ